MNEKNYLEASCDFKQASEETNGLHTFHIVANAGSRMSFYDSDVVVDMTGKIKAKQANGIIPIIDGHDRDSMCAIGHANAIAIEDGKIVLDGVISCDNERARNFVVSSQNGFPWQASIGFSIAECKNVKKGESVEVNGRTEAGAVCIAQAIDIWECSVVLFGADSNTASTITASDKGIETMAEQEKEVVVEATSTTENEVKVNLEEVRKARLAECARIDAIEKLAKDYNDRQFVAQAIEEGWEASKFELETLRASRNSAPAIHVAQNKIDDKAVEVAFIRAAGFQANERKYGDQVLTAADNLRYHDFRDLVEATTGYQPTAEERHNGRAWVQAALSSYNLSSILSTNANAVLLEAFNTYPQQWRNIFKVSSVNDFKAAERYRISSNFEFTETPEGGEFEHGKQADEKWTIQAKTYGKQYALGYQSIINGEALGAFGDIMRQIAFGASVALNKACWSLVMNPANVGANAFYSTALSTLKTSAPLTLDNLSAARAAFITKKRGKGVDADQQLGIAPSILLVPTSLEDKALMLTKATTLNNGSTSNNPADYNPNAGRFKCVAVPELEYANYTNYSDANWYLFADPNQLAAFEIAFLRGVQTPVVRSTDIEIGSLGVKFDGHLDFGVAQEDYRGAIKVTA